LAYFLHALQDIAKKFMPAGSTQADPTGTGQSKREAEQRAASAALDFYCASDIPV